MAKGVPKRYTDEELLEQVRMLARELGRTPKKLEFELDERTSSSMVCSKRFGGWKAYIEAAGLVPRQPTGLTDDEIIGQVLNLAIELGRIPTSREFSENEYTTSLTTCYKHFGSWEQFLVAAGLKHN